MSLSATLAALVGLATRRAWLSVLLGLIITGLALTATITRLGVTTDTDLLFAETLPWRQRDMAFNKAFPQFQDLLVAVVDGASPEITEQTAIDLARKLSSDPRFQDVRRPDASPYLEANGLMFLDAKELTPLLDGTIDAQPFLGQLAADPSARGLFAALALVGIGVERGQADLTAFGKPLQAFHRALASALSGRAAPLSWQSLLAGSLSEQAGPYRFVLARPKLDYTSLVLLWLVLAVRSWRLIVPIFATLVVGLISTTGFAALAVGRLNLVSVAFAILFVGIAVDFAIQFSVRARETIGQTHDLRAALDACARIAGPQIMVAALATAAGFLAFVPTDFSGVAELGLIAGSGMVIAFLATMLFLPAMILLCHPRAAQAETGLAWGRPIEAGLIRATPLVLGLFAIMGATGLVLLPRVTFDSDPLHTKDTSTEAMRTLSDLMANPLTNPYSVDILTPNRDAANALATRLRGLSLVSDVITLSSFVPEEQKAKLALLEDASQVLGPTLAPHGPAATVTAADIRLAARSALAHLEPASRKPAGEALRPIVTDLAALLAAPDATLLEANQALTRFLPLQLSRLRVALAAHAVTEADIPAELARDWRLPDGRVRVQALSTPAARDSVGLHAFVAQVRSVAPDAAGSAVTIVETSATITHAFASAAIGALAAIALLLLAVLRRWRDAARVLAPLLLSALMTVGIAVALPLPLNFANIIALPLLLGVGVSFNIYFVMNWRAGATSYLGTATARAVLFSALTTATAFSSLALSFHPGTGSMGKLLLISLGATLAVTLVFMPPLLRRLRPR